MKKIIIFITIFISVSILMFSVDLKKIDLESNEYYKLAIEKITQAKDAFAKGEYDISYQLSEEAKELLRKADELALLKAYIINAESKKSVAEIYIERLEIFKTKDFPETLPFYEKAKSTYNDAVKTMTDADKLSETRDKINSYASSINMFADTINLAKSALSKLAMDYNTAKDMLDRAIAKRNELLTFKVIAENDNNDTKIASLLKDSESYLKNNEYAMSINKSREAMDFMNNIQLEYIASLKNAALEKLNQAKESFAKAQEKDAEKIYPEKMIQAKQSLDNAQSYFENSKYSESISESDTVLKIIAGFSYIKEGDTGEVYPKYYVVRLNLKRRDCFWRIAKFPFVYNDPFKWRLLYEANKDKLVNPENPHLILPDMIIEIPSIYGETREGTYDFNKKYPKLQKKK